MNAPLNPAATEPRLTSLSHGGGCGCKIAPGLLSEILKDTARLPVPPELLVGIETADDAAVYQLNDDGYNSMPPTEVPPELEEQARLGAINCPEGAIRLDKRAAD